MPLICSSDAVAGSKRDELVVLLGRRRQVVVPQAEIELEVRAERDRILDESADGVDVRVERAACRA